MQHRFFVKAAIFVLGAIAFAQQIPVAPQPKFKSKKEQEAVQAIFNAPDPASRIKACRELIEKFADTDFKNMALQFIAISYQQLNDPVNMTVWAEKTLESDPKNYQAMILIAQTTAQRTRENDLDKEEKLALAEKYANNAIVLVQEAPRPNPQITDQQWESARKDVIAQAHEALGLAAMVRKKNDVAVTEFKQSIEGATTPEPRTMLFLAQLYTNTNKFDEAIAVLDKALATPDLHPQIKQLAESLKNYAVKMKGPAKPAAPAPAPAK